jgi:hypothetical protein
MNVAYVPHHFGPLWDNGRRCEVMISTGSSLTHLALPKKVLHSAAFDHSSFDVRYHDVRYQPICLDSRPANK